MGSSPMSISSIQLSSPLPSPSATPNRQNQDVSHQSNSQIPLRRHSSSQSSQPLDSLNTLFLPPIVFKSPQHPSSYSSSSSSSIYPLADTPTPPALKRIKFTLGNRPALLEELDPSDSTLQHHRNNITEHFTSQSTLSTGKPQDLPTNDETLPRKGPICTQLEGVRTILLPDNGQWSSRQNQYNGNTNITTNDTTTTTAATTMALTNSRLTLESNYHINAPVAPVASLITTATIVDNTVDSSSAPPSSVQPLVSLLPEFATHLPSADGVEVAAAMSDSPSSALPSPISDLDPNDETWSSNPLTHDQQHSPTTNASTTAGAYTETDSTIAAVMSTTTATPPPMAATMMDVVQDDDSSMEDMVDGGLSSLFSTYDALPADIQDYLMFQLLRRSSLPSLRFASDMIMQALRLDFIARLPRHISRRILLYLDIRSLCRASGVSKLWKRVIDGDTDLWRAKIVEAGFTVTATEIEGYGLTSEHLYQQYPPHHHHHHHLLHFYAPHRYPQQMGQMQQRIQQQKQRYYQLQYQSNYAASSSGASSSTSVSSSTIGKTESPCLSTIKEVKHKQGTDASVLDRPILSSPFAYAPADPTQLHRTELSAPSFDNMKVDDDEDLIRYGSDSGGDSVSIHPFKQIYKNHHKMRQNWKHGRGKRLQVKGHGEVVTCLQFDDDKIITGFDDNYINVHDINTGMLRRVLRGHEGGVWALQYVGNTLVTGSTDRTLRVWDIEHGICRFVFRGHTSTVRCLHIVMPTPVVNDHGEAVVQPAHPLIVSGSRDTTLRVWKLPYLPGRSQPASQTQPSTSSSSSSHYQQQPHFYPHPHPHQHQQQQQQEHRSSQDQQHQDSIFELDAPQQPKDIIMDEGPIPTTDVITTNTQQSQENLYFNGLQPQQQVQQQDQEQTQQQEQQQDQEDGQQQQQQQQQDQPQQQQRQQRQQRQQHQQQQQQQQQLPQYHHQQPHEHDFNPFFVHLLEGHVESVRALAAHGNTLASGSYDNTVRLWDLETGLLKHKLEGHTQKVYSVAIDAQRQKCISGSMDSSIRVFNMIDGTCERVLRGHTILVGLLGLTKNYLVSAAADSTLRVWTPDSDDCHHILAGHKGAITTFQHDDRKVISGSEGGLKMWDIKTGELVRDLITDVNGIWRVAFDERRCVAAVKSENTTRLEILDYGTDTEDN